MSRYDYTNKFNKDTYKMYPFRVRRDDEPIINKLENVSNRNQYIVSLIKNDLNPKILTIKLIKERIKPVMDKYQIKDVYLFGSYARGEATEESDVDLLCDYGTTRSLLDDAALMDDLKEALGKDVDVVYTNSTINEYFYSEAMKDRVKLWDDKSWGNVEYFKK